jgi:hypothetical protein
LAYSEAQDENYEEREIIEKLKRSNTNLNALPPSPSPPLLVESSKETPAADTAAAACDGRVDGSTETNRNNSTSFSSSSSSSYEMAAKNVAMTENIGEHAMKHGK